MFTMPTPPVCFKPVRCEVSSTCEWMMRDLLQGTAAGAVTTTAEGALPVGVVIAEMTNVIMGSRAMWLLPASMTGRNSSMNCLGVTPLSLANKYWA